MHVGFSIWSIHIGLFVAFLGQVFTSNTLHRHMSTDDLRSVFHVEHHSAVPDYEIVKIHSIRKREIGNLDDGGGGGGQKRTKEKASAGDAKVLKFSAFGQNLNLNLQKSNSLFKDKLKMFIAEPNVSGSIHYTELPHEHIGDTYQDEQNQAALLLLRDNSDGTLLMEGTIGHDLVVKPVPSHVRKHTNTPHHEDSSLPTNVTLGERDFVHHEHIVYRRNSASSPDNSDYAFMEPDAMPLYTKKKRSKRHTINKREAPYVIYPEILVIVDYDGYRLHGGDNVQIKRYFVSFWNGVDLRYKLLKGPKIRITIAGIIISRGRDATPYLERNRVGRDAIDSAAALTDMGKYLFRERRLPVYDIAVAVTKYDMCRRRKGGRCTKGTAGFAYVGGACVVNKRLEKVNSVAIIEDTGGFSGIIVAAHEVGHLLGAVHDGSPPPTYLGGPGAEKCRWEDGFIMSDLRHTEKGFKWSPCSVSSFHHFLNGDTATCLFNSPHEDESLPRVLPGKLLSLDAQCRKDRGTSACFKDDRVCSQLFCFDAGSGYCVAYRPAAEGSSCGDGQFCSGGRCLAEHENIIPDYSQNTPTYLRRSDDPDNRYAWGNNYWTSVTTKSPFNSFFTTPKSVSKSPFFYTTTKSIFNNKLYAKDMSKSSTQSFIFDKNHIYTTPIAATVASLGLGDDSNCVDHAIIPGALSCFDYLNKFGFEQCSTDYVKRNCCAAHKYICSGRR